MDGFMKISKEQHDQVMALAIAVNQAIKFVAAKQDVRAEPWQETVLELLQKPLNRFNKAFEE